MEPISGVKQVGVRFTFHPAETYRPRPFISKKHSLGVSIGERNRRDKLISPPVRFQARGRITVGKGGGGRRRKPRGKRDGPRASL